MAPAFRVDTQIFRLTRRLGWIPRNATAEQAHDLLGALIPPRLYYRLHLNLIEHGRAICTRINACEYYAWVYSKKWKGRGWRYHR